MGERSCESSSGEARFLLGEGSQAHGRERSLRVGVMNAVHSIDTPAYNVHRVEISDEDSIVARALEILSRRIMSGPVMESPQVVRDYLTLKADKHEGYEAFSVLMLDARNAVIEYREMFRGTLTQTSVYPREVVKAALECNAAAIILTHNHPSGSTQPSASDERLTAQLKSALGLVDVRVLDHIITAGGDSLSMAEKGLI